MKKFFSFLIIILMTALFVTPAMAFAETGTFRKVTASDTYLYFNAGETYKIFKIRSDCFVKIISEENSEFYQVSYMGATGYVKSSCLSSETFTDLTQPYHNELTVSPTAATNLLQSASDTAFPTGSEITASTVLKVVGFYDSEWLYVSSSDTFGYIKVTDTTWDSTEMAITAPLESVNFPIVTPPEPDENEENNGNGEITVVDPSNNLLRILLIIGISIPAVIIVYLIFRPVKGSDRYSIDSPRRKNDYDDRY